jgi:hypothetical protein
LDGSRPHVETPVLLFLPSRPGEFHPEPLTESQPCQNLVPAFPERSPPSLLSTAACGGLRSTPDCRPRRVLLHLSYSSAPSYSDGARDTRPAADSRPSEFPVNCHDELTSVRGAMHRRKFTAIAAGIAGPHAECFSRCFHIHRRRPTKH